MRSELPGGVIAVIRVGSQELAHTIASGLARTSVAGLELTLTTPGATELIADLARTEPSERILAGTVMTTAQIDACIAAGASTIVSPHLDEGLVTHALECGVNVVPGALTPSEIARAHRLGATAVKVFPIGLVGGPAYLRSIRDPLPKPLYVVSGGVTPELVPAYVANGCHAVCIGGALIDQDAAARGDVAGVEEYANSQLRAINQSL